MAMKNIAPPYKAAPATTPVAIPTVTPRTGPADPCEFPLIGLEPLPSLLEPDDPLSVPGILEPELVPDPVMGYEGSSIENRAPAEEFCCW